MKYIDEWILTSIQQMRTGQYSCDYGVHPDRLNEFVQLIGAEFPGKPYCAISNWVWNVIEYSKDLLEEVRLQGCRPHVLYSRSILIDTAERNFSSVLTSLQTGFSHNGVFETKNTVYLMVGPGRINTLHYEAYFRITGQQF